MDKLFVDKIYVLIDEAYTNMDKTRDLFGKEIFQKRFKPVFEGYLTALATVLDLPEDARTELVKGKKNNVTK